TAFPAALRRGLRGGGPRLPRDRGGPAPAGSPLPPAPEIRGPRGVGGAAVLQRGGGALEPAGGGPPWRRTEVRELRPGGGGVGGGARVPALAAPPDRLAVCGQGGACRVVGGPGGIADGRFRSHRPRPPQGGFPIAR